MAALPVVSPDTPCNALSAGYCGSSCGFFTVSASFCNSTAVSSRRCEEPANCLFWRRRRLLLLQLQRRQRATGLFCHSASTKPVSSHSTRALVSASPELAAGHARQLCWHAPSTERSRTDTRDAPRLALAGIVPLPGALADGPTRCSRTAFAGTVPSLGQPRARGRTRETTLLARSLDRALADGHARCSKTSFSWHSSPARSARRRTHEMLQDSLCWHRTRSRPAQSSRPDTRDNSAGTLPRQSARGRTREMLQD